MSDDKIQEAKTDIAVLKVEIKNWTNSTNAYRKELSDKLDDISDEMKAITLKLTNLPCKVRESWHSSLRRQVSFMWVVITALIIVLMKEAFWKQ